MGEIRYKIDVLAALKERGFTTYKLRTGKILAESVMQQIRQGEIVTVDKLSRLCRLLDCQPGDLLEYVPDDHAAQDQPPADPDAQP